MSGVTAHFSNKDVRAAIGAASQGPVVITESGEPSCVLMSIEDYRRLLADTRSVVDWLGVDDSVDLDPGRVRLEPQLPEL